MTSWGNFGEKLRYCVFCVVGLLSGSASTSVIPAKAGILEMKTTTLFFFNGSPIEAFGDDSVIGVLLLRSLRCCVFVGHFGVRP